MKDCGDSQAETLTDLPCGIEETVIEETELNTFVARIPADC